MAEDLALTPDSVAPKNEQLQAPNIYANKQVDAANELSNVLMPGPVMPDERIAHNLRAPEDRRNDIPTNNNMYNEGKVSLVGAVDPNIKPGVAEGMGGDVIKAKIPETDNNGVAVDKEADHKVADEKDEQIRDRIDQDRIDPDANTDVVNKENKVDNDDDDNDDDDGSDVNDDAKSSDLEKGYESDFKGSGTTEDDKEDEDDTGDSNDDGDTGDSNDGDVKEDKNDSDSDGTDENTDDDTTEDNDDDNDGDDDDDMKDNNVYDDDRMDNNDDDDDTEDSDDSKGDVEGSSTENPLRLIQEDLNRKVQDGKYNFSALEFDHLTRNPVCACVCANIKAVCSHLCYKYWT